MAGKLEQLALLRVFRAVAKALVAAVGLAAGVHLPYHGQPGSYQLAGRVSTNALVVINGPNPGFVAYSETIANLQTGGGTDHALGVYLVSVSRGQQADFGGTDRPNRNSAKVPICIKIGTFLSFPTT